MITVKHQSGKKYPSLKVVLYCIRKLLFKRKALIIMTIDKGILGARTGSDVFLKVAGWKSGLRTKKNSENLLAFRVYPELDVFESCEYFRRREIIERRGCYNYVPLKAKTITYTIERGKGQFIPAFPYNQGGSISSKKDFSYLLEIR